MKKIIYKLIIFTFFVFPFILKTRSIIYSTSTLEDLTLSRIYVEPGNLEPEFSETRKYYTLVVNENIDNVLIQATPKDSTNTYEITGNKNLKVGENIVNITVFSKDKSSSEVYTINILKTSTPDEYNALLNTLIIDNHPFNEEFFPEKFEYTINLKNNIKISDLDVFAYSQNSNAQVEINKDIPSNTINIKVTSENGRSDRIYTIKIKEFPNKKSESLIKENHEKNNIFLSKYKFNLTLIILLIILIIYFYMKFYRHTI